MSYHFPCGAGLTGAELRKTADVIGFGMLLMFGCSAFLSDILRLPVSFILSVIFESPSPEITGKIVFLLSYIISLALPAAAVTFFTRSPIAEAFPMTRPRMDLLIPGVLLCLSLSVFGGFFSGLLAYFIQNVSGYTPVMPDIALPSGGFSVFLYVITTAVAPAFLEEIFFRGAIMQTLRRFGDSFALIVSSILFALAHGNLVQGPNSLLMGFAIGFFVLRTGSLLTGIAIHFTNNIIVVVFELVMRGANAERYNLASAQLIWAYILCGIMALTILLPRHPGFFRLPPSPLSSASPVSPLTKLRLFFTSVMPIVTLVIAIIITLLNFAPS